MKYHPLQYAQAIWAVFRDKGVIEERIFRTLWHILIKNRQTKLYPMIVKNIYRVIQQKHESLMIKTSRPLSRKVKLAIADRYSEKTGRTVVDIQEAIDPSVIGGAQGITSSHHFDWTILGQLTGQGADE